MDAVMVQTLRRLIERRQERALFVTLAGSVVVVGGAWTDHHGQRWRVTRHERVTVCSGGLRHYGVPVGVSE
jgi:hypothetical protein